MLLADGEPTGFDDGFETGISLTAAGCDFACDLVGGGACTAPAVGLDGFGAVFADPGFDGSS